MHHLPPRAALADPEPHPTLWLWTRHKRLAKIKRDDPFRSADRRKIEAMVKRIAAVGETFAIAGWREDVGNRLFYFSTWAKARAMQHWIDRCPFRELDPAILVMNPTENRPRDDLTEPLDRSMSRRVLAQGQVRSESVVIGSVGFEDSAQVVFAHDHHVIQALPTDRADQPFGMAVLPP
jgi:hypothetical protein